MKTILTASFIAAVLFTNPGIASNTNSYPEYPVSASYKRAYQREHHWNQQEQKATQSVRETNHHCSDYPKAAKYQRVDRRSGLDKRCRD